MGVLRRVLGLFTGPSIDPSNVVPDYRCLRCGSEFERNHRSCPKCSAPFIAPIEPPNSGGPAEER